MYTIGAILIFFTGLVIGFDVGVRVTTAKTARVLQAAARRAMDD